ncbi:hydrogen gas-evolving membrane-bound hydrogenase subunit E [Candidatus Parabeggiatoa sp. HSG14]|uniref:hydrogen gas-evolving membrane-bound hydrogenase subunit E n=1 Tax=Candidatus Parabeggiatoa sp. HSG14 TaxID=3055593 RepID=UPI0025A86777|nr:MnhB domain-containing protein [Thiotrichales bacterium HSG14]
MNLREISGLIFIIGLGFLLGAVFKCLPYGEPITGVGQTITALAPIEVGTTNIVASVLLAYRGLDTLGELTVLFVAATAIGMVLGQRDPEISSQPEAGFILKTAANILFPFLIILGAYIILHGHLTPGGGFQGGAILAAAFFIPILATPASPFNHHISSLIEGFAGVAFIIIGLLALFGKGYFLAPLFGTGEVGHLFSAGSLPLLYLAVGLKVGAELAGLLARLQETEASD